MGDTLDLIDASGIDNIKDTEDNILPFIADNEPLLNKQDQTSDIQLINTDETYEYDIPDSNKQTIGMTILFVVLMILYLGFCVYYRKVIKTRQAVDDVETSERRQRQHRENQDVLEESMSATTRARNNALEQAKLEERKNNIKKVLTIRLIVDDDDDVQSNDGEGGENEGGEQGKDAPPDKVNVLCTSDSNCKCELCQYWQWESPNAAKSTDVEESKKKVGGGEEEEIPSDVQDDAAASGVSISRRIITIQEEDSEEDDYEEEEAQEIKEKDVDVEAQTIPSEEATKAHSSPTPAPLSSSPEPSPNSSPQGSPRTSQPSPTSSPSRLSLPSTPKKFSDALSCGSSRSGRSYSDALSCGGSSAKLNCSNQNSRKSTNKGTENDDTPTIPFSDIASLYGEECNVCLAHFQVGDRVATSKDSAQCSHVFHDECISRWLLVRDLCPICRRSYFPEDAADIESGMEEGGNIRSSSSSVAVNMATED